MNDDVYCYVASDELGVYAASVITPDMAKDNAKFVAREIKRGSTVDRVPVAVAREELGKYSQRRAARDAAQKALPLTDPGSA